MVHVVSRKIKFSPGRQKNSWIIPVVSKKYINSPSVQFRQILGVKCGHVVGTRGLFGHFTAFFPLSSSFFPFPPLILPLFSVFFPVRSFLSCFRPLCFFCSRVTANLLFRQSQNKSRQIRSQHTFKMPATHINRIQAQIIDTIYFIVNS